MLSAQPAAPPRQQPAAPRQHQPCRLHARRAPCRTAAAAAPSAGTPFCVLLEVDGVLADLHMDGHRTAFNRAFRELGLECAQWTPPIYNDLLSVGDGTGEGLVSAYFSRVGWPTFLPSKEQGAFAAKVHQLKEAQLAAMIKDRAVPLRADVDRVLGDAAAAGAALIGICGTQSRPEDGVAGALTCKLPGAVAQRLRLYTASAPQPDGGDAPAPPLSSSFAAAAAQLKQEGARQFVAQLQQEVAGRSASGVPVTLDAGLLAGGLPHSVSADWLAAIAALHSLPCDCCLVLAASGSVVRAAAAAGMVPVAVPRAASFSATYPEAKAKFEGFGAGYATWPRLHALLRQHCTRAV